MIIFLSLAALFLAAGAAGFCVFCQLFTNEYEHGQFEGGFRYVAGPEDGSQGRPLSGWRLELYRRAEQVFNPLCYWPNRLRGIEKAPK